MDISIQNLIDNTIAQKNAEKERKAKDSWWPSELGQCLCGAYYKRLGKEPEPFDPRVLRVFQVGINDEKFVLDAIAGNGVKVQEQVRFAMPEYDLTGKADAIVNDELPLEIKSCHSQKFWRMKKEGKSGDWHHRMQLWCALKALNKPEGRLVYVSKDDLTICEFTVLLDDINLEDNVRSDLQILNRAWETKIAPEPVEAVVFNETTGKWEVNWKAKYCNYHKYCTGDEHWLEKAEKEVIAKNPKVYKRKVKSNQ